MTTNARIREALVGTGNQKPDKGPPSYDGVLSITPDTPEVAEWRARSGNDCAGTSSAYLQDEDDGKGRAINAAPAALRA